MSGRRLDVTATQAISSMLAALTGAIAASGLGIAGTLIGAAFMSLAGTVGAAIYKHYLARSREKLRAAATTLAPKAAAHPAAAAVLRHSLHLDPEETARLRPDGQAVVEARPDVPGPDRQHSPALADTRAETAVAVPVRPVRATAGVPAAFTRDDSAAAAVAADIAAAVLGDRTTLGHESLGYTAAEHPATETAGNGGGRDRAARDTPRGRDRRRRWRPRAGRGSRAPARRAGPAQVADHDRRGAGHVRHRDERRHRGRGDRREAAGVADLGPAGLGDDHRQRGGKPPELPVNGRAGHQPDAGPVPLGPPRQHVTELGHDHAHTHADPEHVGQPQLDGVRVAHGQPVGQHRHRLAERPGHVARGGLSARRPTALTADRGARVGNGLVGAHRPAAGPVRRRSTPLICSRNPPPPRMPR